MSKITILVFSCFIFLFSVNFVQAGVVINEVQINPIGERFIELYNSDNSAVDLTGWYLQRKTQTGNSFSSLVSSTYFENKTIDAKSYFLISKNALGLSSFSLTESNTIQLKKSEKEIVDKIGWGDCSESCVSENPPEGQSTQKTNDGWIIASPTPGAENQNSQINNNENNNNENNSNSNTKADTTSKTPETKTKIIENPTMKIKILANNLAFSGQAFEIGTNILGFSNENVVLGRVYWNFGDGSSFEQINNFEKFYHTYYYAGEYVVFLEYYKDTFSKVPEITNKMTIKVVPTTVSISKVGDMKDFFIELTNNASSDIDVSNWVINANGKIFVLPKNSVIMSKKQMTISSKITGFVYGDQYNLKLFSPTNDLIFDYSTSLINKNIPKVGLLKTNITSTNVNTNKSENENNVPSFINLNTVNKNNVASVLDGQVPIDNLGAEVIKSDIPMNNNFKYGVFGLIAFLGVSTSAAYVIRTRGKKTVSKANGDDFEIIDE